MKLGGESQYDTYIVVNSSNDNGSYHQEPIGKRHVYLAMEFLRCMYSLYVWEVG